MIDSWKRPYCAGCQHYTPIARYQSEMADPKKRRCRLTALCDRVAKEVKRDESG